MACCSPQPTTFMNLSGWAVREIAAFHKLAPADVLIVVDDADLPLGRLRMRTSGSAGGHNGLKSIIQELGTIEFPRLRIGVGRQPGELKNHVLGRFGADEKAQIDAAVKRAADAAELFATERHPGGDEPVQRGARPRTKTRHNAWHLATRRVAYPCHAERDRRRRSGESRRRQQ